MDETERNFGAGIWEHNYTINQHYGKSQIMMHTVDKYYQFALIDFIVILHANTEDVRLVREV